MKIIYLGKELDVTKEHEIFSTNEFGFKVDIKYTKESWYPIKEDTAYNCTEFHWKYDEDEDWETDKNVAFESDIHRTGFTRKINTIDTVIIELADMLFDSY